MFQTYQLYINALSIAIDYKYRDSREIKSKKRN